MASEAWTKLEVQTLIEAYRQHPSLYSASDPQYHNRAVRQKALQEIVDQLRVRRPDTGQEEVRRKIHGLRTCFLSEMAKIQASIQSCSGEQYVPKLWYFNLLQFLKEHITMKTSVSSMVSGHDVTDEMSRIGNMTTISPVASPDSTKKAKKRISPEGTRRILLDKMARASEEEDDDSAAFGRYVEREMRSLKDRALFLRTKRKVMNLLLDAVEEQEGIHMTVEGIPSPQIITPELHNEDGEVVVSYQCELEPYDDSKETCKQ